MNRGSVVTAAVLAVAVTAVAISGLPSKDKDKEEKPQEPKIVTHCAQGPQVECDALETKGAKPTYRRVLVGSDDCVKYKVHPDGGAEATSRWRDVHGQRGLALVAGSCDGAFVAEEVQDAGMAFVDLACGCRKAKGDCWILSDAGSFQAPKGRTLGPGYAGLEAFAGEGCQKKACTELLGSTSWPKECPR